MCSVEIANGIILKHTTHMTQKKKGRPFKAEGKKDTRIAVKVTKETFKSLKYAPKSQMLNDGLAILMPTLGKKWDGEKWEQYELHGMDANAVAYRGNNSAIEMLMDSWELAPSLLATSEISLLFLLRKHKEELEQHQTFHIQK